MGFQEKWIFSAPFHEAGTESKKRRENGARKLNEEKKKNMPMAMLFFSGRLNTFW